MERNGIERNGTDQNSGDDFPKNLLGQQQTKTDRDAKDIEAVFAHWHVYHPGAYPVLHAGLPVWIAIRLRLVKDGATVDRIKAAIDGMHLDDWWRGKEQLRHVVKDIDSIQRLADTALTKGKAKALDTMDDELIPAFKKAYEIDGRYYPISSSDVERLLIETDLDVTAAVTAAHAACLDTTSFKESFERAMAEIKRGKANEQRT